VRRFQKIDVNEPSIPDTIEIVKGLKPYFEEFHKLSTPTTAIKAAVELSARYINDRKLPDKAIDVIDETGASQMLVPENRRKKTIGIKEIESTIATMARIPPKSVSKNDAEVLAHLQDTLKRVVYGQDRPSRRSPPPSSSPGPACGMRKSPSAPTSSPAPPASARRRSPASSPPLSGSSSCASTCRSTWSGIR
jgi:ATP-dependent Clp protease ATP-binding subunit ClpA